MAATDFPTHQLERVREQSLIYSKNALENTAFSKIFDVRDTQDYDKGYTAVEGMGDAGFFSENENIQDGEIEESYNTTLSSQEFGIKFLITKQERLRAKDPTVIFDMIINEKLPAANASMAEFVERETHKLFNDGFAGAEFLAPDGNSIFGSHDFLSTGTSFDNSSSTVAGEVGLSELEQYAGSFVDANGHQRPLNLKTLIVKTGSTASTSFRKVLSENRGGDMKLIAETSTNVNIYNNGQYTLIETPYITSDTAWFAKQKGNAMMKNSFVCNFIERPNVEDPIIRENLTQVFVLAGSFTFGNVYLPMDYFGSTGS